MTSQQSNEDKARLTMSQQEKSMLLKEIDQLKAAEAKSRKKLT